MRAITINKSQTNIYAIVVSNMANGMKTIISDNDDKIAYTDMFVQDGNISMERGQRLCEAKYGKNCMCVCVKRLGTSGKLSISGDVFLAHSNVCADGATYGHDVITREIKSTIAHCMVLDNGIPNMTDVVFPEVTTDSKLLNWVREATHCASAIVISKEIITERRYMSVADFETLATSAS